MRPRSPRLLISLLLISLSAVAQASRKQHGVTCATCHEEQALPQPATQMAHAMETAQHNNVLARHPSLTFRKDGYLYSVVTKNGHSVYAVSDGRQTVSVPIVWAMGAQAQTWVLERNGNLYESRVSYYPSIQGLEITTGDEQLMPKTVDEAVGRPIGTDEAKACFNCHATNAIGRHQLDLKGLHPGISCERCHLGAQAHATDMIAGSASAPIPQSLGKLPSEDISNFCGQCHQQRTNDTDEIRLVALIVADAYKDFLLVTEVPIDTANDHVFSESGTRHACRRGHTWNSCSRNATRQSAKIVAGLAIDAGTGETAALQSA